MEEKMKITLTLVAIVACLQGCASQATLTVYSQPEGAYLTDAVTNTPLGMAPIKLNYKLPKTKDKCKAVNGIAARWVSGAATSTAYFNMCNGNSDYVITLTRNGTDPGLEKDLQFALQIQGVRAQQQQASAAQDAAAAALFSNWQLPSAVNCTTTPVGKSVQTTCR